MKFNKLSLLKEFLDEKVSKYNNSTFIKEDPICIPHLYNKQQDIEISGFFAAILAWGNRKVIISKSKELMSLMGSSPHDFILNHNKSDLTKFKDFKHRTFNYCDLLHFIKVLQLHYQKKSSIENLFSSYINETNTTVENSLINFHRFFFSSPNSPKRTKKHIATPLNNSPCKRLNMFLRWMVRKDDRGVDFGIWKKIQLNQLVIPCDVHVFRVSKKIGLLKRTQTDWKAALELTTNLKQLCSEDPVIYDFALFGLGVEKIM